MISFIQRPTLVVLEVAQQLFCFRLQQGGTRVQVSLRRGRRVPPPPPSSPAGFFTSKMAASRNPVGGAGVLRANINRRTTKVRPRVPKIGKSIIPFCTDRNILLTNQNERDTRPMVRRSVAQFIPKMLQGTALPN